MPVSKRSVAFDEAVAREAEERAGERGFSRFVNDAVAQRLQAIRVAELYAEYEAGSGPVTESVRNSVAAEWEAASSGRE
jgi:hypothetical protein